ncbi:hypothetical protein J7E97_03835 [Streptomyces sp. ISL-66]|uniref:hypothetical protein n=1 Tax=Streptomyces sp. ISL-66 TaxID=2819186 RepID=UPI001BEA20A2|nr:hypothetical protein [Streptomyces sp. ISL-66]MBT2467023.1 hypothetical protein [Streptomyces sp. ISL-66]
MAEHCVLLLSRRGDREAASVASLLRRIGVPVHRLDADGLEGVEATCEPGGAMTLNGHRFVPTVTWLRHFSLRAAPVAHPAGGQMLYRDSWAALARQLAVVSRVLIGATDPGQLRQLARARALGVRVPRGVVTTDPATAAVRLDDERTGGGPSTGGPSAGGRYVVKALDRHYVEPEPGGLAWFLPRVLEHAELRGGLGVPRGTPVVLQEYVDHDAEFRVYLVGREILSFAVEKDRPRDVWSRPDRVRVRSVETPAAVAGAVRALATAWDLSYGAFDFLSDRGEAVFLEMNAQGDWDWFERKAGVDAVTRAAVRTVRDLHWSATGGSRPGPADLLTFLGAGPGPRG